MYGTLLLPRPLGQLEHPSCLLSLLGQLLQVSAGPTPRPKRRAAQAAWESRLGTLKEHPRWLHRAHTDRAELLQVMWSVVCQRHLLRQQIFGLSASSATASRDSYLPLPSYSHRFVCEPRHSIHQTLSPLAKPDTLAAPQTPAKATTRAPLTPSAFDPTLRGVLQPNPQANSAFQTYSEPASPSTNFRDQRLHILHHQLVGVEGREWEKEGYKEDLSEDLTAPLAMSDSAVPAQHKPLVVGRTKPATPVADGPDTETKPVSNNEPEVSTKTTKPAADLAATDGVARPAKKKEKAPKQPKPPKATPPTAPLSPALIDLRVGHILRAINHPNADSLYVSTIAMGDPEGTEHTQVDEETGKVVRTVCSGLNGLVPLDEMQNRKVVVVANLKPVNMRSIESAAMVLAASPPAEEGADPHASDRVVELVSPPDGAEAGEPVYFEGWEYGEGKGPEKQLNPKKKQWEAIQPGFYTSDELVVGFDAAKSEVEGERKGDLIVNGKGKCTVKTLKGAVVR